MNQTSPSFRNREKEISMIIPPFARPASDPLLCLLPQSLYQGDVVQNTDALGAAYLLDSCCGPKGAIARTKNLSTANNSGLKNGVVVGIAHDGGRSEGNATMKAASSSKVR